ncbi:MAG TPA: alpha/beta fold hydrolase [Casimicrobiaceae bacterium]|nr:alpha/beta fold hydrolase [Casimicrobiaceae bacterium]
MLADCSELRCRPSPRTRAALALLLFAACKVCVAADYAREERWAQEVAPAIVVGDPVHLATPTRGQVFAILAEPSGAAQGGAVIVHGLGVHPDWGVNGALRTRLVDAGFSTLSVQMPVLAADATRDDYASTLPEASERIAAAIRFMRARGVRKIAIVSHSYGATMVNAYLARSDALAVDAWVPVGMFGVFDAKPKEPVLDIVAEHDAREVRADWKRRTHEPPSDSCSRQLSVEGTDHFFDNRQARLAAAIAAFLERVFSGSC